MVTENADEEYDTGPENKLRHNFRLGDITWVKYNGSSWWPSQVRLMTLHLVSIPLTAESVFVSRNWIAL